MRHLFLFFSVLIISACKTPKPSKTVTSIKKIESFTAINEDKVTPTIGLNLGNQAPEIIQTNLNDSLIKLSSLRGKLVLLDFWASWCGPCRKENPTIVKAYSQFKNKIFKCGNGFSIYSVSLDTDKNLWQKAVEKDGLIWPYHVSDLKAWNNEAAQKYAVQGIPHNVLINEKGVIINKNLRGNDLLLALEKLVVVD